MNFLNKNQAIDKINGLASAHEPFLFLIDYKAKKSIVLTVEELNPEEILFEFGGKSNVKNQTAFDKKDVEWKINAVSFDHYKPRFGFVKEEILKGNSYLINFTQPAEIEANLTLTEIFYCSKAKYKLWLKDWFVVFSPETFVKIENGVISSFPMKGTIDASISNAENIILNDVKEMAEHATIVDLIRNDLSMVAENVEVKRFRYVEKLKTNQKDLLQVSSHIEGKLPENYLENLGEIIFKLLPAGSISGAPKPKTLEIIDRAEGYERGFYTGICGYFDGKTLNSGVMIRFIEQTENGLVFKSGGGITFLSSAEKEYEELIQKVYVPIY